MFESLSGKLGEVFERLRKRGALTESDVSEALREVRVALLEADVALPVVKSFIDGVKAKAVGQEVLRSVTPGQMVIKIVHDHLVEMLGGAGEGEEISLAAVPPVPVLMVGLQGSGKTTSTAKIALRLQNKERKKVLMASLDVYRPAAQEQLRILGEQTGVATLPIVPGQMPVDIAKRALQAAKLGGFDVLMLDTAGRLHIDEPLMLEVAAVRDAVQPHETLLVADALTGQDAVNVAKSFNERVGITGIVLTRVDGDGRGGAALSMRAVTGKPIKLIGVGEKMDALESFHPERIAQRILGMGDIVSLVEKAAETIEKEEAERLAARVQKGQFDLDDMASQLKQLRKMGGMSGVMGMLPGIGKIKQQLAQANIDETILKRQEAIIGSMTKEERKNPKLIHASRKKRIAAGSGTSVQDVNKLLKQHMQMADMMKRMSKLGQKGFMRSMGAMLPGMPGMPKL
ncbi:signal recognition particle protein [uncultured Ferrovibrio sp.]|jgi:signal recognition particle subunit SRP54|uniref:signal recognition particle protein n=1 Tax=uncultured Ferrovibrio sp. TaxID=1576913 RepID=UPI0026281D5C|nr:signal recognition particle protein [uncultured Ferrovibrio sp.]